MTYLNSILGGASIGIAALLLWWGTGKVMGASGILRQAFTAKHPTRREAQVFILASIIGGAIALFATGPEQVVPAVSGYVWPVVGGLCVGIGTGLANGCTSGHGVCGIARLSKRSIVSTILFMLAGFVTVAIMNAMGVS